MLGAVSADDMPVIAIADAGRVAESADLNVLERRRREQRPRRWLRRNAWAPLGAVAIMVVVVATTQLVLAVGSRKDDLRQAQIAIAAAGQTEFAMMHSPVGLIRQTRGSTR